MNPIPNKAPYVWKTATGQEYFNPLAIREIRFALNWLMDRKRSWTDTPGRRRAGLHVHDPRTARHLPLQYHRHQDGHDRAGDEKTALSEIAAAMEAAASSPKTPASSRRPDSGGPTRASP
jgi:peptide/nickel transport system substrate-binding protein